MVRELALVAQLGKYELVKNARSSKELTFPVIFYILALVLFPFAIGSNFVLTSDVSNAFIWVSAILTLSISLERIYSKDFATGAIDQLLLSGTSLALFALMKAITFWISSAVLMVIVTLPLALSLGFSGETAGNLLITLFLVSASISLIGSAVSALTTGLEGGAVLNVVLLLPLFVPVLIFGASATSNSIAGVSSEAELYFLTGFLVVSATLAPFAGAIALRLRR